MYSNLLSSTEYIDIYGQPILSEVEIKEHFSFNKLEKAELNKFKDTSNAVYFAVCLAYYKIKKTFVDFNYQNITAERRHVISRYFPSKPYPRKLISNNRSIAHIENKVLKLCGYSRCQGKHTADISNKLVKLAPNYPRQRQLCKALLDLFIKNNISINIKIRIMIYLYILCFLKKLRNGSTHYTLLTSKHAQRLFRLIILLYKVYLDLQL